MVTFFTRIRGIFGNEELAKADAKLDSQLAQLSIESGKLAALNSKLQTMREDSAVTAVKTRACHRRLSGISNSYMKAVSPDEPEEGYVTAYRVKHISSPG